MLCCVLCKLTHSVTHLFFPCTLYVVSASVFGGSHNVAVKLNWNWVVCVERVHCKSSFDLTTTLCVLPSYHNIWKPNTFFIAWCHGESEGHKSASCLLTFVLVLQPKDAWCYRSVGLFWPVLALTILKTLKSSHYLSIPIHHVRVSYPQSLYLQASL